MENSDWLNILSLNWIFFFLRKGIKKTLIGNYFYWIGAMINISQDLYEIDIPKKMEWQLKNFEFHEEKKVYGLDEEGSVNEFISAGFTTSQDFLKNIKGLKPNVKVVKTSRRIYEKMRDKHETKSMRDCYLL
uniref:Uncharacterized protein n=1 Tax=Strigamia maritima TaxID=126957 RepID=T1IRP3_STRMM